MAAVLSQSVVVRLEELGLKEGDELLFKVTATVAVFTQQLVDLLKATSTCAGYIMHQDAFHVFVHHLSHHIQDHVQPHLTQSELVLLFIWSHPN